LIFDVSIKDDYGSKGIGGDLESDIVKIFDIILDISRVWMKRKLIWKRIFESISQRKRRKEFIIPILHVD